MLPKNRRIPRKDFKYILTNNKRYVGESLLLYMATIPESNKQRETKVSFSVSKKVCSKAVDRNRNRRRGYSVVSEHIKQIKLGYFLFFTFKKNPEYVVLKKEINQLLYNAGMVS